MRNKYLDSSFKSQISALGLHLCNNVLFMLQGVHVHVFVNYSQDLLT